LTQQSVPRCIPINGTTYLWTSLCIQIIIIHYTSRTVCSNQWLADSAIVQYLQMFVSCVNRSPNSAYKNGLGCDNVRCKKVWVVQKVRQKVEDHRVYLNIHLRFILNFVIFTPSWI
jgi:hypothetical protein